MTDHRADSVTSRRRIGRWVLTGVATALLLTGCTEEGQAEIASAINEAASALPTDAPATEAAETVAQETEAPATEAPATEAPATEAPATESGEATDGDATDWIPLVLIALVVLALLWFLISAMRRSSDRRQAGKSARSGRLGDVIGTGRWVHDQGVPEIQRTNDPDQLRQYWQATRQRMVAMEEETNSMLLDAQGDPLSNALKQLNDSSQSLRSAVDGDVAMRSQADVDPDLVAESARTVQERRRDLNHALDRVATFR